VIYAYAAMWIIAAGFVVFLWRRQRGLEAEIEHLRRDLDAAEAGGKART
jgi:CcmD family protein